MKVFFFSCESCCGITGSRVFSRSLLKHNRGYLAIRILVQRENLAPELQLSSPAALNTATYLSFSINNIFIHSLKTQVWANVNKLKANMKGTKVSPTV